MKVRTNTILIVEDDAGILELLSEKVEESGYSTACVQTGADALYWLKMNTPFLIVLDYGLPDMNGKELLTELLTDSISLPPFIVSTGQGDERIAVDMMKLGARDYIAKDIHFLEMIPLIVRKVCTEIENDNRLKSTEQELAESNQYINQIIQSAQEGIIVYDHNLKYQVWNPFMEKLVGLQASEVLGKYSPELFPFLEDAGMIKIIKNALYDGISQQIDFQFQNSETGKWGWASDTTAPLRNAAGQIVGAITTVRDITEQKNAEETLQVSEKRYRTFINSTPDLVFLKDEQFKHVVVNKALCEFYNKTEKEIIGKTDFDLMPEHFAANCQASDKEAVEENKIVVTEENVNDLYFETVKFPIEFQKGQIGVGAIIRNITDRKQAEQVLKDKMEEMNRFHRMVVGRELTMVELKKEINELLEKAGQEKKYKIAGES